VFLGALAESFWTDLKIGTIEMNDRLKVAHHEAAHAVVAYTVGAGIHAGIDLDTPSSVGGAFGCAAVNIFSPPREDEGLQEAQEILLSNIKIVCAGAASDAKILRRDIYKALDEQPGDKSFAEELLKNSPLIGSLEEAQFVLNKGLCLVEKMLQDPQIWGAVESIAQNCIKEKGRLSKIEIEKILANRFSVIA
jgi:hypothetical protein